MRVRFCFFLLLIISRAVADTSGMHIAVSDLIADHIEATIQTLAEDHSANVSVSSMGSLPAIDSLYADEILLAVIAAPEDAPPPEEPFKTIPFAYSTAVVAVNVVNPISEVSVHDLRGIFGADPDLNIELWGELGVLNLANRPIRPLVKKNETSISAELFQHTVLQGGMMKLRVNEIIDAEIEGMLVDNAAAIAVLPHVPDNATIKALMISADSGSPAFGPTNDNVYYGDYPIRLPFQIVYKKENEAKLVGLLQILLSDEVADALRAGRLHVPPDTIREGFANSLSPDRF